MDDTAQRDHRDVERLVGELAHCENDLQVALARTATAREEAARLQAGLARAQEGLAERDVALAAAGAALEPFARCYRENYPHGMDDGDALPATPTWMERAPILYGDLPRAAEALSAPALSRAVALDRARREYVEACRQWFGMDGENGEVYERVAQAGATLRTLEAEPASGAGVTRYVAGFAVNSDHRTIALVRKARPSWQAGRLNGIGGHVEEGEKPIDAMQREFLEETGVEVVEWQESISLAGEGWRVHFFVAWVSVQEMAAMRGAEDEPIEVHPLEAVTSLPVIPNLHWLVPLVIDKDRIVGELRETAGWVAPAMAAEPTT